MDRDWASRYPSRPYPSPASVSLLRVVRAYHAQNLFITSREKKFHLPSGPGDYQLSFPNVTLPYSHFPSCTLPHATVSRGYRCSLINTCTLDPGQTYVSTVLRPLRDWQFPPFAEVATRSPIGPGEVAEKSATSRDLAATKSVAARFLSMHKNLAATDLVADRSRQSRRPVPDQSPTSRRPIAD